MIKRTNRRMTLEERVTRLERLLSRNSHLVKAEVHSRTIWDGMAGIPEVVDFNDPYFKRKIEELAKRFSRFNAEVTRLDDQSVTIMTDNLRIDIDYGDKIEKFTVYPYDHDGDYCDFENYTEESFKYLDGAIKFASKVINKVESQLH